MNRTEVLVIGSGPGGYVAAIRAAQLGKKVTVIEKNAVGGVCLNVGCIPSKALIAAGHRYQEMRESHFLGISAKEVTLDFPKTQHWKNEVVVKPLTTGVRSLLKKNRVTIIEGEATFISSHTVNVKLKKGGAEEWHFEQAIIATGSQPIPLPNFPFGGRILDSTAALNLSEVPQRLVVIGGGYIGCELAGAYRNLGAEVTIIEGSPQLLPSFEEDIQHLISNRFQQKGVQVVTAAHVLDITQTAKRVHIKMNVKSVPQTIMADYVLVTVGRQPNTSELGLETIGLQTAVGQLIPVDSQYRTVQPHILAIGDVISGPALAHKASYDGKRAGEICGGKQVSKDYRGVPAVCFTDPEIATVGLTKEAAAKQGINAAIALFPLQGNGRARSLHQTEGFIRLVFKQEDQTLLGAQLVGVNASELIGELTLAIESFLTLEDIALTIHSHPSLSETIMDACELGMGFPIHA